MLTCPYLRTDCEAEALSLPINFLEPVPLTLGCSSCPPVLWQPFEGPALPRCWPQYKGPLARQKGSPAISPQCLLLSHWHSRRHSRWWNRKGFVLVGLYGGLVLKWHTSLGIYTPRAYSHIPLSLISVRILIDIFFAAPPRRPTSRDYWTSKNGASISPP